MLRRWFLRVCFGALGLLPGCGADGAAFSDAFLRPGVETPAASGSSAAGTSPTWTILVYGHGDSDLSNGLLSDLAEMASAQLGPDIQLLVFADWDASRTIAGAEGHFPEGAMWYRVRGEGHELERFGEREELDFDDPGGAGRSRDRGLHRFPSERRGVVLWNHGGAWSVGFGGDSQDGTRRQAPGLPPSRWPPRSRPASRTPAWTAATPWTSCRSTPASWAAPRASARSRTWPRSTWRTPSWTMATGGTTRPP